MSTQAILSSSPWFKGFYCASVSLLCSLCNETQKLLILGLCVVCVSFIFVFVNINQWPKQCLLAVIQKQILAVLSPSQVLFNPNLTFVRSTLLETLHRISPCLNPLSMPPVHLPLLAVPVPIYLRHRCSDTNPALLGL